ncbi:hypothetical protein L211DRAFT_850363 [Terfezia boudieri ATCC MYA-4762]|uniref:Uncharacterized protein n=1 Tax=Terfezia boudieri ATCC MYA-4762 TaxID=1051890 RepID=A0A3N4LJL1_9PEZI|nr:hypothetical protein L211DRAFT_850363 [Terfezia boudieri ATCC MYA-4762]
MGWFTTSPQSAREKCFAHESYSNFIVLRVFRIHLGKHTAKWSTNNNRPSGMYPTEHWPCVIGVELALSPHTIKGIGCESFCSTKETTSHRTRAIHKSLNITLMDQPNLSGPRTEQNQPAPGNNSTINQPVPHRVQISYPRYTKGLALITLVLVIIIIVTNIIKPRINYTHLFTIEQWQDIIAMVQDPTVIPVLAQGDYSDGSRTDAPQNDFVFGDCLVRIWVRPKSSQHPEPGLLITLLGLTVASIMVIWVLLQAFIGV